MYKLSAWVINSSHYNPYQHNYSSLCHVDCTFCWWWMYDVWYVTFLICSNSFDQTWFTVMCHQPVWPHTQPFESPSELCADTQHSIQITASLSFLLTYQAAPALILLPGKWFSPGRPRTAPPERRCRPGQCSSGHPKPQEPCRNQSRRWRRSAAWSDPHSPLLHSSYSGQNLPP